MWRIPAGSIDTVFIVNPTLHDLGGHAPQLGALKALGLFPDGDYPWSIFINDLRVIAETAENAAVFLHYLVWRSRLDLGGRVAVHDEIDLWGSYLLNERFPPLADEAGQLMIGNSSTDFDSYYAGVMGHAPPRRKPRKFIEEPVSSFVSRMAAERPTGWLEAAGVCLDLSIPEVAAVCGTAKRLARAADVSRGVVHGDFGRIRVVGLPEGTSVEEGRRAASGSPLIDEFMPEPSAAVAVYCRTVGKRRASIAWAEYLIPPAFGTSAMEEAVFNAPATSPFGR